MKHMSSTDTDKTSAVDQPQETSPWDAALDKLREWDPAWAETCKKMFTNPWTNGIIPLKTIELICVALNGACTNLQPAGTGRHIRAALDAGATRLELKMTYRELRRPGLLLAGFLRSPKSFQFGGQLRSGCRTHRLLLSFGRGFA